MVGRIVALFLLLSPLAQGQNVPYNFKKSQDKTKPDVLDATGVQEDFEYLYNQIHQQKVVTSNLTVNGVVISVGASSPLCTSGGPNPVITFCGSLTESQVTNLTSDLANNLATTVFNTYAATVGASTTTLSASTATLGGIVSTMGVSTASLSASTVTLAGIASSLSVSTNALASGSATTYLHVDGSNSMVGQLTVQSSATFQSTVNLATIASQCLQTDGSGNVTGTGSACAASTLGTIGFLVDNFRSQANGTTKVFTLTTTPSLQSEHVILDGQVLSPSNPVDYTLSGVTLTLTTAPASACTPSVPNNCTSEFFVKYASGAVLASNAAVLNATQTFSGANTFAGSVNGGIPGTGFVFFSSGTFSSVSTVTVSGLASSTTYRCLFNSVGSGTLAQPYLVFNQAGNAVYPVTTLYSQSGVAGTSSGAPGGISNMNDKYLGLSNAGSANGNFTVANPEVDTEFSFWTLNGTSTTIRGWSNSSNGGPSSVVFSNTAALTSKSLSAPITDFEYFFAAATSGTGGATITGKFICWKVLGY